MVRIHQVTRKKWLLSSAWLERRLVKAKVVGSSPTGVAVTDARKVERRIVTPALAGANPVRHPGTLV